jgi:hypothetical protein
MLRKKTHNSNAMSHAIVTNIRKRTNITSASIDFYV